MPPDQSLPRATPEAQGVSSAAVDALVDALERRRLGPHSLMVVRHGQVVAEGWWAPYEQARPHIMFSVSKSFSATAVGIAQDEGRLSVDEPILDFFPSYATPAVRANMEGVRLRHLLSMATGHGTDTMVIMRAQPNEDWVKVFFEVPIEYPPGTHFLYNSGASFVLSAVVASRTGQQPLDYLGPRLFEPLGIATPPWQTNARGFNLGASGLRLRTEDVAKFGQLYLQRGRWGDRQLLSEAWVAEASRAQVDNGPATPDWSQGYGYQLWRSQHDSYRADGAYGQFALILPHQDLVVAITSGSQDNREVVPAVWETLLPGLHDEPLPAAPAAAGALAERLGHLAVPVPDYLPADPPAAAALAGRRVAVGFNRLGVAALEVTADDKTIALRTLDSDGAGADGREETIVAGRHDWLPGVTRRWPYEEMETATVAARGGWVDERTLQLDWQCVDTPFRRTWQLVVEDDAHVTVTVGLDLGFWADDTVTLPGTIR